MLFLPGLIGLFDREAIKPYLLKRIFRSISGYNENLSVMEGYDLTGMEKKPGKYKIMRKASLISASKYDRNSWWHFQEANYIIVKMYKQGVPQDTLVKRNDELIR
jgi:hypothetical protein